MKGQEQDYRWHDDVDIDDLDTGEWHKARMLCSDIEDGSLSMESYAWLIVKPEIREKFCLEPSVMDDLKADLNGTVCLCGSSRFRKVFQRVALQETLAGKVVLMPEFFNRDHKRTLSFAEERLLVDLHFRKIEMADEVLVINDGFYIGESTQAEIVYAERLRKRIRYLYNS